MKTLVMLVVAGGLYAADGTVGSFGKPQISVKPQVKSRTVTNIYKPGSNTLQFNNNLN